MGFKDWVAKITGRLEPPNRSPVTPSPAAPTEHDIMNALDRVEAMVTGGVVPAPVQSRVKRVTSTVRRRCRGCATSVSAARRRTR